MHNRRAFDIASKLYKKSKSYRIFMFDSSSINVV